MIVGPQWRTDLQNHQDRPRADSDWVILIVKARTPAEIEEWHQFA